MPLIYFKEEEKDMDSRLRWALLTLAVLIAALAVQPAAAHVGGGGLPGVGLPATKGAERLVTAADPRFDVLVFSRTTGFRHTDAIDAGKTAIAAMGTAQNFSVTATEDATQFNDATLRPYEVIVMLHPDGEGILNATQRTAYERWLQRGKGVVGIHAAANADRDWDWMTDLRGGSLFLNHPSGANQFQQATVKIVDPNHPATQGIPADWVRTDRVCAL